jgi:hypothetical protein
LGSILASFRRPRRSLILPVVLALGLVIQLATAGWIMVRGFTHVSPYLADAFWRPSADYVVVLGALILLSSLMICWRHCVYYEPSPQAVSLLARAPFFHESWYAAVSVALLGLATLVARPFFVVDELSQRIRGTWSQYYFHIQVSDTANYISLAAAILGFVLASRRREQLLIDATSLPTVAVGRFVAVTIAMTLFLVTAVPIFTALGITHWVVPTGAK